MFIGPAQTPHYVASEQGLHCLLTGFSIKIEQKRQNRPDISKMTNGLVQHITESTSMQWVKLACECIASHKKGKCEQSEPDQMPQKTLSCYYKNNCNYHCSGKGREG